MTGRHTVVAFLLCAVLGAVAPAACGGVSVSQPGAPRVVSFRQEQTTTVLRDGRVLVLGGRGLDGAPLASGEIYDRDSGAWTPIAAMGRARAGHTASLLLDGRVLVAGGTGCRRTCTDADALATAELYDPASGAWAQTTNMHVSRSGHAAVVLGDGRVLVAGGRGIDPAAERLPVRYPASLRSAELYDPRTGRWSTLRAMHRGRAGQFAATLRDGRAVMAGGYEGTIAPYAGGGSAQGGAESGLTPETVEVFDSATGAWTLSPRSRISSIGWIGTRTDGTVVALGGLNRETIQVYDPDRNRWSEPEERSGLAADRSTVVRLDDTRVLSTGGLGGLSDTDARAVAETAVLSDGADRWTPVAAMTTSRVRHTAVRLTDGTVLVYGGYQYRDGLLRRGRLPVMTSEIYDPEADRWTARGRTADLD